MISDLPSINLIKNSQLKLNLNPILNQNQTKNKHSRNKILDNKILSKKNYKNRTTNSLDDRTRIKRIGLTSLLSRKPKTIYHQLSLSKKSNSKDLSKLQHYRHSKIFNKPLIKSSSIKLYPTGSLLKRLSVGNIDEIEKFEYYQKIEDSKSYQDYLLKERAYIPQESIDNSFAENSNNLRDTINNIANKKSIIYKRNSLYDMLNPLNKKNMMKIKIKFKNQDKFEKYIIETFIKNQESNIDINKKDNSKRNIFIILDGEIIINENDIKGYFMELPYVHDIKTLNEEKKEKIVKNILKKSEKIFRRKRHLLTIFSPDKELICDLKEIKDDYKYLYVSSNIICKGISLVTTPSFLKIYEGKFKNYLKKENIINDLKKEHINEPYHKKYVFKSKGVIKGIKPKYEIYKPHYSFAEGEDDIEYEDYIIYSDNEEKKELIKESILNSCYLKNDFFLYLSNKNTEKKLSELKPKLKYNKPFDLRESYKKFTYNFDILLEKYKKEVQKQLKINPKIYKISNIDSKVNSHNLQYPKDKLTKLYMNRKQKKPFIREQLKNSFYTTINKNVTKYYTPFILYNIPKLLSEFKNYTRHRLYEIYTQYKDLVVMSYAKNKSDFILKCGVDFDTFWYCVEQLSDEKKKYVEKIYNQINRSKLCVLNMKDFLRGMYFIQNSEITEKLDLFLKALDFSGKGVITYKEAVEICKDSIQRNLSEKKQYTENNIYALNELSQFFANFIFKLIGVDTSQVLVLNDLKKAILEKNNEFNEIEYLEMFCGANK